MCLLRGVTVSLVSPSFMRRMSLAASRFLSRLQSSFRDTNPPRSSFSTYCNTHTHTHTHTFQHTVIPPKIAGLLSVLNLHEHPWHYWRKTMNSRTDRSTAAWKPVTHRHKHTHLSNGYSFAPFLWLPHFLSQEMDRGVGHSCCQSAAMDQRSPLHLSRAHITRLYCIKMSLMREGEPGGGSAPVFVTLYTHIKTT